MTASIIEDNQWKIYLSDSGCPDEGRNSKQIVDYVETNCPNVKVIYEDRDFTPGQLELEGKQNAILSSLLVVILLSDKYIEKTDCMYDAALASCLDRKLVIIDKTKKHKLPHLVHNCQRIKGRKKFPFVLQKLKKVIDNHFSSQNDNENQARNKKDKAQIYVWNFEQSAYLDYSKTQADEIKRLNSKLQKIYNDRKIARRLELLEVESVMIEFKREQRTRFQLEREKRQQTEVIRSLKRENLMLKQNKCQSCGDMTNEGISTTLEEANQGVSTAQIRTIRDLISQILRQLPSLDDCLNGKNQMLTAENQDQRISSELKCFCQKYEKMIGPNIRRFAQLMGLSASQVDTVEEYRKHGHIEMFWQTIKLWHPKSNDSGSFVKLLNALEEIGVDIEGRPMSTTEVNVLHEKLPFIMKNCYKVTNLVPYLLSKHVLTEITEMFVSEPTMDNDKLLRLVNVLTTKENGLKALCDAFISTNQEFIAEEILNSLPAGCQWSRPVELSDISSGSTYSLDSSDDTCIKVAMISPMQNVVSPRININPPKIVLEENSADSSDMKHIKESEDKEEKKVNCYRSCCIQ